MRGQAPQIYLPVSRFYLIYCLNKSRLVTLVSSLLDPVTFQTAYLAPVLCLVNSVALGLVSSWGHTVLLLVCLRG